MINIAFRYSCGFQDRGDTRCKFTDTVTMAELVPDSACPIADGVQMIGPCMKCRTPEFNSAELMTMRITLNAVDFTTSVDFITYGEATVMDATFITDAGMKRTKSQVTAGNLTELPQIEVSAQDSAGNTALEDLNKQATISVRVIKGTYLTEDPKLGWTDDPGATADTDIERLPWEHTFEFPLASASAIIPRGALLLLQPKDGTYRVEFSATQRCYATDAEGDEPFIGLNGFGTPLPNPSYVALGAVSSCNAVVMQVCVATVTGVDEAICAAVVTGTATSQIDCMDAGTVVTPGTTPCTYTGGVPADNRASCEAVADCTYKGPVASTDLAPSLMQLDLNIMPGDTYIPNTVTQSSSEGVETCYDIAAQGADGCDPDDLTLTDPCVALIPLNQQRPNVCWNIINPMDPYSLILTTRDVADNTRTNGGNFAKVVMFRPEAWCTGLCEATVEGVDEAACAAVVLGTSLSQSECTGAGNCSYTPPDPTNDGMNTEYGFVADGMVNPDTRNCRAPTATNDKVACECPVGIYAVGGLGDRCIAAAHQTACEALAPEDGGDVAELGNGCTWYENTLNGAPQCEIATTACQNIARVQKWDRDTGALGVCWKNKAKAAVIEGKDNTDGSYSATWNVDVTYAVANGIEYMGEYLISITIQKCDDEGENCNWIDVPGSPFDSHVVPIDCSEGSEQDISGTECWCLPGYEPKNVGFGCQKCGNGEYKVAKSKDGVCSQCPFREDTNGTLGNIGQSACVCAPGYYDPLRPYTSPDSTRARRQLEWQIGDDEVSHEGREVLWCYENGLNDVASFGEYLGAELDPVRKAEVGPYPGNFAKGRKRGIAANRMGEYRKFRGRKVRADGKDSRFDFGHCEKAGEPPGQSLAYGQCTDASFTWVDSLEESQSNADEWSGVWAEAYYWATAEDPPYVYTYDGHIIKTSGEQTAGEYDSFMSVEDIANFRCQRCPDGPDQCNGGDGSVCDAPGPEDGCAVCSGNETIGIKPGWWAAPIPIPEWALPFGPVTTSGLETNRVSRHVFRCNNHDKNGACLGGENIPTCKPGHNGVTCAGCTRDPLYAVDGVDCTICNGEEVGQKIGLMVLGVIAASIVGYFAVKYITPEIAVKGKILMAMGQVLGGFKDTYQIKWPAGIKKLMEQFKIFDFDLFTFGNMGCQLPEINNFYYKMFSSCLLPAFLIGVIVGVYVLRMVVLKGKRLQDKEPHSRLVHILEDLNFRGVCFSKGFFILIVLYLKTSATTLKMFHCRVFSHWEIPVSYPAIPKNVLAVEQYAPQNYPLQGKFQVRVLEADYNLNCDDEATDGFTTALNRSMWEFFGVCMVCTYPLGVPGLFMFLLVKNRATINDSINVQRYGFIFKDYGPIYFFWEIWDLMRKLTMSGLLIFFDKGSADQLSIAILFSTFACVVHARAFPYTDMMANWIQFFVLLSLELTLFGSLILKMQTRDSAMSQDMIDAYLVTINIGIPGALISVVAYEVQQTLTANARAKLLLAKKRKRQQQLLEDSQGVDLRDIMKQVDDEQTAEAERLANKVGLTKRATGAVATGTGMNMMGVAGLAMAKGIAHRVNVFSQRVTSAKDLFPTLADEKLAVKKLQFDKERADERYEEADREATDLAEWIAFARTHNASENELMSFVKAFGDELLGEVDVHSMDPGLIEIERAAGKRKQKSSAVVLADNYPFIRSAAMALRRHHFD